MVTKELTIKGELSKIPGLLLEFGLEMKPFMHSADCSKRGILRRSFEKKKENVVIIKRSCDLCEATDKQEISTYHDDYGGGFRWG